MKTTVDIPKGRLDELLRVTGKATKKDALNTAIEAYLRDKQLKELLEMAQSFDDVRSQEELQAMRRDG